MGSLGFSKSKSQQTSESQQSTFVDPSQAPFLQNIREGAQSLQQQQQQLISDLFPQAAGLQQQGQEFIGGLQGTQQQLGNLGGFGQGQGGINALQGIASGQNQSLQALQAQATGGQQLLGQQITGLGEDINQQLQRQLGGGAGIAGQANLAGQLGGGRQGVESGLAQEAALTQFQRGATGLRQQNQAQQLQASQAALGAQAGAGQALGQLGLGQNQQQLQALLGGGQLGLGGLQSLQGQFNLGLSPFQAEFQPLQNLAGILGGPTVLSQATSQGQATASAFQASGSFLGG
jgi:hypothetical protein